ncbi:hypothetical protein B0H14DRAFT_2618581 [Mycena olivaceomarginata]|nr:hypothetical protein B0H14DRAFT_2618581 [Mycena olivaceomarginata]
MDPIDTPVSSEELLVHVELRLHMADTVPHSIKQLGHQVRTALVYMLELIFLYLSLCTGHSKAIHVMSEMHRDWAKNSGLVGYDSDSDSGSDSAGKMGSEQMKKDLPKSPKQCRVANPAENPTLTCMSPLPHPSPDGRCMVHRWRAWRAAGMDWNEYSVLAACSHISQFNRFFARYE